MDKVCQDAQFDYAVKKLVEWHKGRGEWIDEKIVAVELRCALDQIASDLLDEPVDYFSETYRHIHMHYAPEPHSTQFFTLEDAQKALPDAEKFFGKPMEIVQWKLSTNKKNPVHIEYYLALKLHE